MGGCNGSEKFGVYLKIIIFELNSNTSKIKQKENLKFINENIAFKLQPTKHYIFKMHEFNLFYTTNLADQTSLQPVSIFLPLQGKRPLKKGRII